MLLFKGKYNMSQRTRTTNKSNYRLNNLTPVVNVESTDNTVGVEISSMRNGKDGTRMNLSIPVGTSQNGVNALVSLTGRQARVVYETLRRHFDTLDTEWSDRA